MVRDLAQVHQPVSDLFEPISESDDPQRWILTPEQIDAFRRDGYVAGPQVLTMGQVEALREELEEWFQPNHPGRELWHEYHTNESPDPTRVLFHALGAWRIKPGFHDLLWNRALTVPASQLLGGDVRFWHDQLFCKPAHHGGVVAWHQDYSYWTRTVPMQHLTAWIALDDSRVDNGCLQYVAGSHHWDLLPITGLAGDMDAIRKVLNDDQWDRLQNPTPIELPAGHAAFHHPLLIHGSFANDTDRPRRAVVINMVRDGTRSDSDEPLLEGVPPVPKGQPLDGPFFPLLLQA